MTLQAGTYSQMTLRDYLAAAAVNASLLQTLATRCPYAAWFSSWLNPDKFPELSTPLMDAGSIAHAILLEGDYSRIAVIDPNKYPAKTTGNIPEGWTNQDIRRARDEAILAGKIPILKPAMGEVENMVAAARAFLESVQRDEPQVFAAFQRGGGESEVSMFWDDGGTPCKIRPDRINTERTLIVDYKTGDTSAEPNTWGRVQMIRMGYYVGAAFYRRGVQALCGTRPGYVYLVQESKPPYLCSLVGMDEAAFETGAAQIDYAIGLWKKCVATRHWPAYPPRVCYPEIPAWESVRVEEQLAAGELYDPANSPKRYALETDPAI